MQEEQAIQGRTYSDTRKIANKTLIPAKTWELWRRTGFGPEYIRIGKRVLYDEATVIAWLDHHKRKSTSEKSEVVR